ncbi:hypothetical protein ACJ41O_013242 [Fusarium nematophilum]
MADLPPSPDGLETSQKPSKSKLHPLLPDSPGQLSSSARRSPSPVVPTPAESTEEKPQQGNSHSLVSSWWLECSALVICLSSFAAVVYLLFVYNGQPISKWAGFPLSLNAVVSILSGISRASLAYIISMCLSQAKWNWATRYPEPLIDFDRFDAASRGAWGSLRLVKSFVRRPHWAFLGALAAITLLAFDPLIQAILTFEDQPTAVDGTQYTQMLSSDDIQASSQAPEIGRSSRLDSGSWTGIPGGRAMMRTEFPGPDGKTLEYLFTIGTGDIRDDMGIAAAIWNGFSPLVAQQNLLPSFACATGNCSWDNIASLAVCSSCYDMSNHVKQSSRVIEIPEIFIPGGFDGDPPDISNPYPEANRLAAGDKLAVTDYEIPAVGLELSNYNGKSRCISETDICPDTYLSAKVTTNPGHTISFRELNTMLLAIQILQANESWRENKTTWEDTAVTAHECSLYFCVNEYEAVVEQGVLHEKVVSSWNNRTAGSYSGSDEVIEAYFEYLNHSLDMEGYWSDLPDLQISIPDQDYASRADNISQQSFNVTLPSVVSLLTNLKGGFELQDCQTNCTAAGYYIYPSQGGPKPPSLMAGLGETRNISSTFENVALSLTKWMRDRELASSSAVQGEATTIVVITRVEWRFLYFPAATLLVGIAFAVLSIWETHRLKRPAWKDSALATLAHAPTGEFKDRLQAAAAAGKIAEAGRVAQVVMEYHDGIGQLVFKEKQE